MVATPCAGLRPAPARAPPHVDLGLVFIFVKVFCDGVFFGFVVAGGD